MLKRQMPYLPLDDWVEVKDGDLEIARMYRAHYSARKYRDPHRRRLHQVVGPGEYAIWTRPDLRSIAIFRKSRAHLNGQEGIYLAAYIRNDSPRLASLEIRELVELAFKRWPDQNRIFTYVNPAQVKSKVKGYSFIRAGWKKCGVTKKGLIIFEIVRQCRYQRSS